MKIVITNEQDLLEIDEAKIKTLIKKIDKIPKQMKLSIVYINDKEMTKLNKRYLEHDETTDVLSFPYGGNEGEIIVSVETAIREANKRNISPEGEILLYTFHGILHLIGYDDKTDKEAEKMHAVEEEILTKLGYSWSW